MYSKKQVTVYTRLLPAGIIFTIAFPAVLFLYFAYYNALSQSWIFILISPFAAALILIQSLVRNTKINYISKTIEINDGAAVRVHLLPMSVQAVSKTKLGYTITKNEGERVNKYNLIFALYSKQNQRKILDAIAEFNPDVHIESSNY